MAQPVYYSGGKSIWNTGKPDQQIKKVIEKKSKTITMQDIFEVLKDRESIMLDSLLFELLYLNVENNFNFVDKRLQGILIPLIEYIKDSAADWCSRHKELSIHDSRKIVIQRMFQNQMIANAYKSEFVSFEKYLETKYNVYNKSKNKFFKFKILKPSNIIFCYEQEEEKQEEQKPIPDSTDWW